MVYFYQLDFNIKYLHSVKSTIEFKSDVKFPNHIVSTSAVGWNQIAEYEQVDIYSATVNGLYSYTHEKGVINVGLFSVTNID